MSTLTKAEKLTKNAKPVFVVEPNKKYLITELPNSSTPEALRALGRVKMGGDFRESVGAPWDDDTKRYDTGLNKYSREFFGKSQTEVNKILKERKELAEYLDLLTEQSGLTEVQFLAGYSEDGERREPYKLNVFHGKVVDTSDRDEYLKLYLACRSNLLMPSTEKGNIGKYGSAMYQVGGIEEIHDTKNERAEKEAEVITWVYTNYEGNKEKVFNTLIYANVLEVGQTKERGILVQLLQLTIKSYDNLERIHKAITEVDYDEIKQHVAVKRALKRGTLKRSKKGITYEEVILGYSIPEVVRALDNEDHIEIAEKVYANK